MLPIPVYGQENLSGGRADMGKSPHRGGAGPLFPEACSGIPGEGHGPQGTRGPEGHGGQGKEGPEAGMRPQMGTISRNAGGRPAEDIGMCRPKLSLQNKDSLPAADRACGLRCSGPRAAGPGRGEAVRAGSAESRRQLPCPGALHGAPEEALPDAGRKKAPAGQGLSGQKAGSGRI